MDKAVDRAGKVDDRDKDLVGQARDVAFAVVDQDPALGSHPELEAEVRFLVEEEEAEFLFKS